MHGQRKRSTTHVFAISSLRRSLPVSSFFPNGIGDKLVTTRTLQIASLESVSKERYVQLENALIP